MPMVIHVSTLAIALPLYVGFALLPYFALGPDVSSDFLYAGEFPWVFYCDEKVANRDIS